MHETTLQDQAAKLGRVKDQMMLAYGLNPADVE